MNNSRPKKFGCFVVVALIMILFWNVVPGAFLVSEESARKTLENHGFSDVKVVDRSWFLIPLRGGGKEDVVRFDVYATNPAGKKVEVSVFVGWPFKGATIRGD